MKMHKRNHMTSWLWLGGAVVLIVMAYPAPTAPAATVAWWDFENFLPDDVPPVDGMTVPHPSPTAGAGDDPDDPMDDILHTHDDAIPDISGNGNHLSAFAMDGGFTEMQFSSFASISNSSSAFSIENATATSTLSTAGDLQLGGSDVGELAQWTVEASVNFKAVGGFQTIVGKDGVDPAAPDPGGAAPLYFQKFNTDQFRLLFRDAAENYWEADSTTVAVPGEWYNIAATSDGTTLRFYVNGVEEGTTDLSTSTNSAMIALDTAGTENNDGRVPYSWSVMRGIFNNGHTDRVNAYVDDVRISNTALTPDQFLATTVPSLSLLVNNTTGEVMIRNDTNAARSLDYYRIESPTDGALLTGDTDWNSLSDQGVDIVDDGADAGETWQEFDASVLGANLIGELFIQGETTLGPGERISLGSPYNFSIGGQEGDLEFVFSAKGSSILRTAQVVYADSFGVPGDYNDNGVVDAADFTVYMAMLGSTDPLPNEAASLGIVDIEDYAFWKLHFGDSGSGAATAASVPEPTGAMLALLAAAGACLCGRRRDP